jgi:hypothetical protein
MVVQVEKLSGFPATYNLQPKETGAAGKSSFSAEMRQN